MGCPGSPDAVSTYRYQVNPSTASVEDAIVFAVQAHRGQHYPSPEAEPYNPSIEGDDRVLDPVDQMAAVLHDVVEDTDREIRDLVDCGFPRRL